MKLRTIALIVASLTILSSCSCKPKIEYVPVTPVIPSTPPLDYPDVNLRIWGDYAIYKAQCEAKIDQCNADIMAIEESLEINKEE